MILTVVVKIIGSALLGSIFLECFDLMIYSMKIVLL